jgi:hypothetical protein
MIYSSDALPHLSARELPHATEPSTFNLLSYVTLLSVRRSSETEESSRADRADGSLRRVSGTELKETTSNGVYLYYVQINSTTGTAIEPHH